MDIVTVILPHIRRKVLPPATLTEWKGTVTELFTVILPHIRGKVPPHATLTLWKDRVMDIVYCYITSYKKESSTTRHLDLVEG